MRLLDLVERLKPTDLLTKARATVLGRASGHFDLADGEDDEGEPIKAWEKADRMAEAVGGELASAADIRRQFVAELIVAEGPQRPFQCGVGIASKCSDLREMWEELANIYHESEPSKRDARLLAGFLFGANERTPQFVSDTLDGMIGGHFLSGLLPYFQTSSGIDRKACDRLKNAISAGGLVARDFSFIANGSIRPTPAGPLKELLVEIAAMPGGLRVAIDILHMRFHPGGEKARIEHSTLISFGRELLAQLNYADVDRDIDYKLSIMMGVCLVDDGGSAAAATVCAKIHDAAGPYQSFDRNLELSVSVLFKIQPLIALNAFLMPEPRIRARRLVNAGSERGTPVEFVDDVVLKLWADQDPQARYPAIGQCLNMFVGTQNDESAGISPKFETLLNFAPDKPAFVGDLWHRVHPRGGFGSLTLALIKRKELLEKFVKTHPEVQSWYLANVGHIDQMIAEWRLRDSREEESFE